MRGLCREPRRVRQQRKHVPYKAGVPDTVEDRDGLRLAYENDVIAGLGCLLTELIVQFLLLCAKFDHAGGHENAARIEQSEDVESRTAAARV